MRYCLLCLVSRLACCRCSKCILGLDGLRALIESLLSYQYGVIIGEVQWKPDVLHVVVESGSLVEMQKLLAILFCTFLIYVEYRVIYMPETMLHPPKYGKG